MNLNSFPQAFLLFVVSITAMVILVKLFPAPRSVPEGDPDWLDKQQPRCKHCGERNFWHVDACSSCGYLSPAWNAAVNLGQRPLEPTYFAKRYLTYCPRHRSIMHDVGDPCPGCLMEASV